MSDTYDGDEFYLRLLLSEQRVLQSRLNDTTFFQDVDSTLKELKRIQAEITYLKEIQPELFL